MDDLPIRKTPVQFRAARNDGTDEAHATHVTGIAAGSRVEGSNFQKTVLGGPEVRSK